MSAGLIDQIFDYLGNDECGSSGDKNYIKFPNGTMICYGSHPSASGNWAASVSFPETFASVPFIVCDVIANVSAAIGFTVETKTVSGFVMSYNTNANAKTLNWLAIGRWK